MMLHDVDYVASRLWEDYREKLKMIVMDVGLDQKVRSGEVIMSDYDAFLRRVMLLFAESEYNLNNFKGDANLLQSLYNLIFYVVCSNHEDDDTANNVTWEIFCKMVGDAGGNMNELFHQFVWWMLKNIPRGGQRQ
jgi:hypothetical protein